MIFFQLIIPEELGTLSLRAGSRGWFKGSLLEDEYLAVARVSQAGDGEAFFAPGSGRLFEHWSFINGTSVEKLVPWVAVKAGFDAVFRERGISKGELSAWTADGLSPELPDGPSMLCCIEPLEGRNPSVHLLLVTDKKVSRWKVQTVSPEPSLPARLDGLGPMKVLERKRVAVVGVGSGGSMAALNLAAAGVGTLQLLDKDELSMENLFRHACDMRHLGRAKVLALRDLIRDHDLPSEVLPHEQDVVSDAKDLWGAMSEVDLVICATDNVASRRLVNYVAVHTVTPLVMACTFRNARVGEIIRVLPGESACYECTRIALREAGALEPVADGDDAGSPRVPYGLADDDPDKVLRAADQGTRADVSIVAALATRVAIMTLLEGEHDVDHLPSNYLAWGARTVTDLSDPFNFERPFGTNWAHIARRENCSVCAGLGSPHEAELDEEYKTIMAGLTQTSSS